MSRDSLVRKISSRLYYLACYRFFFSVLDTEGTYKKEVGLSLGRLVLTQCDYSSRFLQVPNSWPSRGQLTFRNVSLVYR